MCLLVYSILSLIQNSRDHYFHKVKQFQANRLSISLTGCVDFQSKCCWVLFKIIKILMEYSLRCLIRICKVNLSQVAIFILKPKKLDNKMVQNCVFARSSEFQFGVRRNTGITLARQVRSSEKERV